MEKHEMMSLEDSGQLRDKMRFFEQELLKNHHIDPNLYVEYNVKRGLRDSAGKGVLTGLTEISDVTGYDLINGRKIPAHGRLYYQGYNVNDIVDGLKGRKFGFEETIYLLLFGRLPSDKDMEVFKNIFDNLGITEFARPSLGISDILDILIVAYIIYKIIFWIKETRAWVLFKGILVIFALAAVAMLLKLNTILWILSNTISVGIIAVIVVFQPELRKALEQLGKGKFFTAFARSSEETDDKAAQRTVDEIVKAAEKMGSVKTGALILIEQKVPLGDFERTGIPVDAIVSSQLLINIFEHNTPLHDGAVIVRRNRVAAATCFLPLTDSNEVSMELGTRHRAAIGASEVSDAYVIVVSEETGAISLARGGVLYRDLSPEQLKNMISQPRKEGSKKTFATIWKGRQEKE